MGVVCCMTTSCSSDNEDGGTDGVKGVVVDGAASSFAYGYYDTEDEGYLNMEFSNVNLANKAAVEGAKKIEVVTLTIQNGNSKDIKEGTFHAAMVYWAMEPATKTYLASGDGLVSVTIKKSGSGYSVTIPKTEITYYQGADAKQAKKAFFSFAYNGTLTYFCDFSDF